MGIDTKAAAVQLARGSVQSLIRADAEYAYQCKAASSASMHPLCCSSPLWSMTSYPEEASQDSLAAAVVLQQVLLVVCTFILPSVTRSSCCIFHAGRCAALMWRPC